MTASSDPMRRVCPSCLRRWPEGHKQTETDGQKRWWCHTLDGGLVELLEGPWCPKPKCGSPVVSGTRRCEAHQEREPTAAEMDALIGGIVDDLNSGADVLEDIKSELATIHGRRNR